MSITIFSLATDSPLDEIPAIVLDTLSTLGHKTLKL